MQRAHDTSTTEQAPGNGQRSENLTSGPLPETSRFSVPPGTDEERMRAEVRQRTADRERMGAEPSTAGLIKSIATDAQILVRKEIELARHELVEAAMARAKGMAAFGAAAFFALIAFVFALTGGAWALMNVFQPWAAWLIVAGGLMVVAGIAAAVGIPMMRKPPIAPEETKRTVKEDIEWAKQRLKP